MTICVRVWIGLSLDFELVRPIGHPAYSKFQFSVVRISSWACQSSKMYLHLLWVAADYRNESAPKRLTASFSLLDEVLITVTLTPKASANFGPAHRAQPLPNASPARSTRSTSLGRRQWPRRTTGVHRHLAAECRGSGPQSAHPRRSHWSSHRRWARRGGRGTVSEYHLGAGLVWSWVRPGTSPPFTRCPPYLRL